MRHSKIRHYGACALSAALLSCAAGSATALGAPPESYQLLGIVRDFSPSHEDFHADSTEHAVHSAGNVSSVLNAKGLPAYTGAGVAITTDAKDSKGRPIAPSLVVAAPVTNFTISGGTVTASAPFAAKVTVIGAAISYGGSYDMPVTMEVKVGSSAIAPFGSFTGALSGNVNDSNNPRSYVLPSMVSANTPISVDGTAWVRKSSTGTAASNADWKPYMTVNSASGGVQVQALRNGDAAPNVAGFMGQVSAKAMLAPYINTTTKKVTLKPNQVIYLFELGGTSTSSASFDMQDLVVLVDLATDPSYFNPPATSPAAPACGAVADVAAVKGSGSTGGIDSAQSFSSWFADRPGYNVSAVRPVMMLRGSDGVYSYSAADFHPIDGDMYGNGGLAHNRGFTYAIDATFSYCKCTGQFFEFTGDGEAWLYVDGKLAMDLGGVKVGASQYVEMDRLGLTDGQEVTFKLFTAQRSTTSAGWGIKTNIVLQTAPALNAPPVSALQD